MFKKIFTHTALYGLAPQIPRIAVIITLPIITKHLTEVDFGVFGVITAIIGSLTAFATLGLNLILVNSFYRSPGQYKWAWRQIYGFLIIWNIPFALLLALLLYLFIPVEASNNLIQIIVLNIFPIVFFGPTATIGNLYFQLKQKPLEIAIRGIIFGFLAVCLNVYFIADLNLGYMGWFLSICISTTLSQISYWYPVTQKIGLKPIFNFKWRFIKKSLSVSLSTVPHYYSAYLLEASDRLVMKWMDISITNIGKYNAAYTIGNLFQQIGLAAGTAISPMLNQLIKENDDLTARKLVFVLQVAMLILTFVSCIWLKEVFYTLIKNEKLKDVYPIGIIIVMSYNFRPMYIGASSKLFFYEKTGALLRITFIAGLINLILNLILIPYMGYKVAAFTTFGSLMYMGYSGYFLKDFKKMNTLNYYPFTWLFLTIFLTVFSYYIVEVNLLLKAVFTLISITIGIFVIIRIISVSKK